MLGNESTVRLKCIGKALVYSNTTSIINMGLQGAKPPGSYRNFNVELAWEGFHQNTGQLSQLSKYRWKLSFYRKYRNYLQVCHAC